LANNNFYFTPKVLQKADLANKLFLKTTKFLYMQAIIGNKSIQKAT
jgi:hypothetical protein